jgi:DNA-binding transcriptional MerR regulator
MTENASLTTLPAGAIPDPGKARLLEEISEIERRLEVVKGLIASGATEPDPGEILGRRTLSIKQAAEILGIHQNSVHRVAQAGLIPHDRFQGWGGGRGGQYRFSAQELAEAKPYISELVSKARRLLSVDPEKFVSLQHAVDATGLTERVITRLVETEKVEARGEGRNLNVRLKDLYDAIIESNTEQNQGRPGE